MGLLRGELNLPSLPRYLGPNLRILFVGFNPGERSAQIGHYYGHPSNRFWWLLWQSGLTDRLLRPDEDHLLPQRYGYGLTDIVARPSKSSGDLAAHELQAGRNQLLETLRTCAPAVACYNGKGIYRALTGRKSVEYGLQPESALPGTRDFVAASPSGRSREPLESKLELYRQLRGIALEKNPTVGSGYIV